MEAKKKRYQYGTNYNYIEGSAARKRDVSYQYPLPDYDAPEREKRQAPKPQVRSNPRVLTGISKKSLFVLTIAIAATLYCCIEFIMLQNEVSKMESDIVTMEKTLNTMRNENNAGYEQINMVYNLDYVYDIAVNELGMVYPNNNEVITFDKTTESYVRQYEDIPD